MEMEISLFRILVDDLPITTRILFGPMERY